MDVSSTIVDTHNSHNYFVHNSTMVISSAVVDNLRARYWTFLFENLQRAVNELYQRCEMDGNISECKEIVIVLEDYTCKFRNLAEKFGIKENENTPLCKAESIRVNNEDKVVALPENSLEIKSNGTDRSSNIATASNDSPTLPHDGSTALDIPTTNSSNDSVPKTDNTNQLTQDENVKPKAEIKATPLVNGTVSTNLNTLKYNPRVTPRTRQAVKYPNIIRSKTSIEIKSRSNTAPLPLAPVPKTNNDVKELPVRSRRSSKDSDGWETVISRRSIPNSLNTKDKPKSFDVNKRFYKPTPSSSLPILANMEAKEKSPDISKSGDKTKNRNRNSQDCNDGKENITQPENYNHYKRNKERPIISNIAMFTTISPSKRKKSSEKDFKKKPAKESRQRKLESESVTKKIDENLTDEELLRESKELRDKEISLQQEINDLQSTDFETDVDSDGAELDPEIAELCQSGHVSASQRRAILETKYSHVLSNMTWAEHIETLDKLEELLDKDPSGKNLRIAKNFTSLKQFEDLVARSSGRALELHQKLSSPSRNSPDTTILQHKARLAKARLNREQLLQDKTVKIRERTNKIAEVKAARVMIVENLRKSSDQKLKRAEKNRNLYLKNIQEKAHDEAIKQKEIAFINELEAQNKRHDFNALRQEQEDRFKSILEERQRRQEEKAAKDAAVEERRKAIEAVRQEKIKELREKMRKREERIDRELQEKQRERIKTAREKARDREDRLLALQAAQIANAEELQKRIQQKQENSARRHEENIELIRQRAIDIGTPRLTPYQINKLCSVCNVVIDSEVFLLSHLRGTSHQEAIKKYREQFEASVKFSECSIIKDAPADVLNEKKNREKERQKTLRKRCKKIRQRLSSRSEAYLKSIVEKDQLKKIDSSDKRKISKSIKEIEKLISTQDKGAWPNNSVTTLERNLFDLVRALEKPDKVNQQTFRELDGFTMLSNIYSIALDLPKNASPYLPLKCFVVASNVYTNACNGNVDSCLHVLLSNNIVQILDLLLTRLNLIMPNSDDRNGMVVYKADTLADVLMNLSSIIISHVTSITTVETVTAYPRADITQHLQDVVSYTVCTGIVDKLAVYCSSVHDNKSADSYFLLHSIELLTSLVETRKGKITDKEDCTQLMATLRATELVGAVSMLYAILLHQDSMSSTGMQSSTAELLQDVVNVIIATLRLFSKVCELNLEFFQNVLGAEGISLQVRHIISYLLRYCVQNEGYTNLLHHVIEFIGFFAIRHRDNQMILQSGSTPTVLQQLSNLPFAYFSNPNLVRILFPTLLACCVNNNENRTILDQEMSYQLLEDFKNSDDSKDIPLIQLLQ